VKGKKKMSAQHNGPTEHYWYDETFGNYLSIGIVGSMTFNDYPLFVKEVDDYLRKRGVKARQIVSGGAKGTDSLASRYANERRIEMIVLKPKWKVNGVYDPTAAFKTNDDIVNQSDIIIAFWNGHSKGTKDTITKTEKKKNKGLHVVLV
jgi:hypothetical protein